MNRIAVKTVYFDVDDTLIIWPQNKNYKNCDETIIVDDVEYGIHTGHVNRLIQHHKCGDIIVVWSASGAGWVQRILELLKLEDYVDVMLEKPVLAYDDKMDLGIHTTPHYLDLDGGYIHDRSILDG